MTNIISKDKNSLQDAKDKTRGTLDYREMKDGRITAAKRPIKRKNKKK
jgi:hypothetical protein